MKIKLNSSSLIELAKAVKSGYLDLSKINGCDELLKYYKPPRHITDKRLEHYIKCLYDGSGYIPNSEEYMKELFMSSDKLCNGNRAEIENGNMYKYFIELAFMGMVAKRAIGGLTVVKDEDFSFLDQELPY